MGLLFASRSYYVMQRGIFIRVIPWSSQGTLNAVGGMTSSIHARIMLSERHLLSIIEL